MMKSASLKTVGVLMLVGSLAGCDTSQGIGRFLAGSNSNNGPDEFGIVPTKPLQLPEDLTALPEPAPGTRNLTDPLPEHDAVAALGGRPERLDSTRIGAGEGALLKTATRNGVTPGIRQVVSAEDKAYRKKNGPKFLQRIFKVDTYLRDYEKQTLQARETNDFLRRRGIKTPTVGPEEE